MRAIGYFVRPDSDGSAHDLASAFLAYCDLNLHQPVKTFEEVDVGGTARRPAFNRMLEFMRESGSGYLAVVPDSTHLGDDLESVARSVVELERLGAKVTCDDEDLPDPFQNAFKKLGVRGVSRTRSARIRQSMQERALRGQGLGKPPHGYHIGPDGMLEVVREEAAVIELIYRLQTKDGLGLRLIAQHLNERGITTRRGGRWNVVTIRDILKNPTYTGTYSRFGLRLPRKHEAIIPSDVFRKAQEVTRARRPVGRVTNAEPYLLSGLAYCGYCSNKMMGVTRRQAWKRKDGRRSRGVYRYYQCQSRNNQSVCGYHTWRAPLLEGTVLAQLRYALVARDARPDHVIADRKEEAQAARDTQVKNAERRFLQAVRRTAAGEMNVAMLGEYLTDLDKVRKAATSFQEPADAVEALARWDAMDFAQRQGLLAELVTRIVVMDDTVEVSV